MALVNHHGVLVEVFCPFCHLEEWEQLHDDIQNRLQLNV